MVFYINKSIKNYLAKRLSSIKNRCIKSDIPFDLTLDNLISLYESQKGLCFYTDIPMLVTKENNSKLSLSVDRIIPDNGYIKDNIVLCTKRANTIKNDQSLQELKEWMPEWYKRLETTHNFHI